MIVTSNVVELVLPQSKTPRSEGVHLSGLIRGIAMEEGILKPEWDEEISISDSHTVTDQISIARMCMGLAWEEWYIKAQLPEVADHPGEMCVDGIFMTPDGEELTTLIVDGRNRYQLRLVEVKCTYKSLNTVKFSQEIYDSAENPVGPMSNQWMWLAQTKGYCYGHGTRFVDLHVLFVCTDYKWPQRPLCVRYAIEFTDAELESNWNLMKLYRDHKLEEEARRG